MTPPRVEILSFDGCPNREPARALVERVAAELQLDPSIGLVEVTDPDAAITLRFLGSPTVRVNGRDVEPGADERRGFALSCRIYRSGRGISGLPDEAWIRDALGERAPVSLGERPADEGRERLQPRVAAVLALAEMPASKLGPARRTRLTDAERELYFWVLRHFATSGRPSSAETREAAAALGVNPEPALETLAREDLVHRAGDGEIAVAYPFSGRPTAHRVRFPGGHEVDAMCAIDALGIAPMLGEPIEITSRDPLTGGEIAAQVKPNGEVRWLPESAVAVCGVMVAGGDSCQGCCPVLNFFVSPATAERWLSEHPRVRGNVVSMQEAAAAGRAVFGDVLTQS